MITRKRINHRIVSIVVGVISLTYVSLSVIEYSVMEEKKTNAIKQIENYKAQNASLLKEINSTNGKISANANLSYYASNIYAYCVLEEIQVEIANGLSKYKNTIQMHLSFSKFSSVEKFNNFIIALSLLGYIEDVTKNSLVLNVVKYSSEDAKKALSLLNNNKE